MTIDLAILILSLCSLFIYIRSDLRTRRREQEIKRARERNNEVYKFRLWVLDNMYHNYDKLPSYEEMVYDGKPLRLESYFKEILN